MTNAKTMKRRLRKKKHVGEFQEFGFHVGFEFEADLTDDQRNALLERFLREAIEANGLQFGGGGIGNAWTGFTALNGRGSATEHHRQAVEAWMRKQDPIRSSYVGPLIDAWYGDFDGPLRVA